MYIVRKLYLHYTKLFYSHFETAMVTWQVHGRTLAGFPHIVTHTCQVTGEASLIQQSTFKLVKCKSVSHKSCLFNNKSFCVELTVQIEFCVCHSVSLLSKKRKV